MKLEEVRGDAIGDPDVLDLRMFRRDSQTRNCHEKATPPNFVGSERYICEGAIRAQNNAFSNEFT